MEDKDGKTCGGEPRSPNFSILPIPSHLAFFEDSSLKKDSDSYQIQIPVERFVDNIRRLGNISVGLRFLKPSRKFIGTKRSYKL